MLDMRPPATGGSPQVEWTNHLTKCSEDMDDCDDEPKGSKDMDDYDDCRPGIPVCDQVVEIKCLEGICKQV